MSDTTVAADPATVGSWELLPFHSEVLAIHTALLPTGKVLFFAGSGNNRVRFADPRFGDTAQGLWTSVVWDPAGPPGDAGFAHPDTPRDAAGKVVDFFCGGDTPLPDGSVLSAGGTPTFRQPNPLGLPGRREVLAFDPRSQQ